VRGESKGEEDNKDIVFFMIMTIADELFLHLPSSCVHFCLYSHSGLAI
jgi:hypothetical protein